jgi:hypothetical protein
VKLIKYLLAFTLVVLVLITAGCSSISIRTAVEIDATNEEVYTVLDKANKALNADSERSVGMTNRI